jgi:hypothetical protein
MDQIGAVPDEVRGSSSAIGRTSWRTCRLATNDRRRIRNGRFRLIKVKDVLLIGLPKFEAPQRAGPGLTLHVLSPPEVGTTPFNPMLFIIWP